MEVLAALFAGLLDELPREGRLTVMVVEDAHWADEATGARGRGGLGALRLRAGVLCMEGIEPCTPVRRLP